MLWIALTVLITIVVLKLCRRFSWSPAHLLRLEGYEWFDDVLDWVIVNCDWLKLSFLISESIQEQFKTRAPPGWTLKFEGPPKLPTGMETVRKPPRAEPTLAPFAGDSVLKPESIQPSVGSEESPKSPKIEGLHVSTAPKWCPVAVQRVRTVSKNPREMVISVDVKLAGWLQEAFITSRHTNQLESSKCTLELVKLTGQVKVRLANSPRENTIDVSTCFSGTPNVNILIPRMSFKKEETLQSVERLLKESISNCGVRFSLSKNTEKNYQADSQVKVVSSKNNMRDTPLNEVTPKVAPNRLKVKVLKANSLYDKGNHEAYCVVSVDSPPQTQRTSSVADSPNPFFDELLTFQLDETTRKVSFAIQDKSNSGDALAKADLLLRDVSSEGLTTRGSRLVLPLVSQQPTSHMSLTIEVSSATDNSNHTLKNLPQLEVNDKSGHKNIEEGIFRPTRNPSINVEKLPVTSQQNSGQIFRQSLDQPQWRRQNSQTDSNLSLVSQASLLVRNNSNESEATKGRPKRRSLMDAMKKKFRGKRSRSAEPSSKPQAEIAASDVKVFSDGIYLTPPPKRLPQSGMAEHWSLSSSALAPVGEGSPNKKKGKMSSFKNIFRKKDRNEPLNLRSPIKK